MVIGCEAELYLHKLQAETKRVSELTRSISERSQSRLTWSRACAPCTCLAHFGRTCTGLDRGVSGDPVRGGRAELLVLCGGRDEQQGTSCWCCVGGRAEQQASQPPIWGDGNRTCFFFFFFARSSQSLFFLFFGHACRHQVQTRRHNPGHQVQARRHNPGHQVGQGDVQIRVTRVWHLRQFHWEEIWLSGSDQPIPGANEFKATGCAALTLISGYARLSEDRPAAEGCRPSIRGRSGCLGQFINHLARPAPNPARRKRPS